MLKERLRRPVDGADAEGWRESRSAAFRARQRQTVRTSKDLAVRVARLAEGIRGRINEALAVESERGELRRLYKAFRGALTCDLGEEDFADMYAQTVACGLLSASISRRGGALVANDLSDMVPNTNPFLKELMQTFLTVGGRKSRIDFDELGAGEVVELLRHTRMDEVLKDFGARNPQEDPVIHFYELFLKEYDPEQRMKRGVFYTPRPVVSFIVRGVDEILRAEFGLEDGLADTTTWGEMRERHEGLNVPEGVSPDEPFVQILDPATGTGTFLVEVIDRIFVTMRAKWRREGRGEREARELWNEYVPRHLLPRLHGFELMMAPYAIAHMKIGLKLTETQYGFLSSERARVYLTNTLEEPKDFSGYFEQMAPALAHEAQSANEVKRSAPITVVVGNPPYSGISGNMNPWIDGLLKGRLPDGTKVRSFYEVDGRPLGEKKLWLQDDYVKFIRYGQHRIDVSGAGVLGYISNHGYLDNPTFRGMRQQLMQTFPRITILDLHGNTKKKERAPGGLKDVNVFDIEQGVAVGLFRRGGDGPAAAQVRRADLWGERAAKYDRLLNSSAGALAYSTLSPNSPHYFFSLRDEADRAEYEAGWKLTEMMPVNTSGIVTARDDFVTDVDERALLERIEDFRSARTSDEALREKYFRGKGSDKYPDGDSRGWKLPKAREAVRSDPRWRDRVAPILYRPFDERSIYYAPWMVDWPRPEVMKQFLGRENLGLCAARSIEIGRGWEHVFCTSQMIQHHTVSIKEVNYVLPLYIYDDPAKSGLLKLQEKAPGRRANFSKPFVADLVSRLPLSYVQARAGGGEGEYDAGDVFAYVYAILHSPTYRSRYAEFLKVDFPRVPLTSDAGLFRKLCALGADLVALHLLEDDYEVASWNASRPKGRSPLKSPSTRLAGRGGAEVAKGYPRYKDGNVYLNPGRYFEGVPEEVWDFHVGGYQVCEKWLKDRRGRTLSEEDVAHYRRVVTALRETIRLMAEVDRAVAEHGGWPLAGSQEAGLPAPGGLPFA